MCKDAIERVSAELDNHFLNGLMHAGDQNKDGKIDWGEFLVIMHNVLEDTTSKAREQLLGLFGRVSDAAIAAATLRRDRSPNIIESLPWGFSRDREHVVYDEVEEREAAKQPPLLSLQSFTLMAREVASHGVAIIVEADTHWTKALPRDLRKSFREVLEPVRSAAIEFTNLHNPGDETALSDLDEIMTVLHIIQQSEPTNVPGTVLKDLLSTRERCHHLARDLQGFVFRLKHRDPTDTRGAVASWPAARTLPNDLRNWREAHMETWAGLIAEKSRTIWSDVTDTVKKSREWYAQFLGPCPKQLQRSSSLVSSSSHSLHSRQYNALHLQALDTARGFCSVIRNEDESERAKLRAQRRKCTLADVRLNSVRNKTFFAKGKFGLT